MTAAARASRERWNGEADDLRPERWLRPGAVEALCAHPAQLEAVAGLLRSLIDDYAGNRLLNQVLSDRGRVILGLYVCFLAHHPRTGDHGVTLSALQALCRQTGLCSPGRTAPLLALMRFGGFIVMERDPADGRKRRLAPSPKLLNEHRRRWSRNYAAMCTLFPKASAMLSELEHERFRNTLTTELGTHYLAGFRPLAHAPALATVVESSAGLLIVDDLVLRQREMIGSAPFSALPISISANARRFGGSRAHVRNVLARAETAGLLTRSSDGTGVLPLPLLATAMFRFFAALFLLFNQCGSRALVTAANEPA